METKWCKTCNNTFELSQFYKRYSECKMCVSEKGKKRYYGKLGKEIPTTVPTPKSVSSITQTCKTCNVLKSVSDFPRNRLQCNECKNSENRALYNHVGDPTKTERKCKKCNATKYLIDFRKSQKGDKYFRVCNTCWDPIKWSKEKHIAARKKYETNNPEKIKLKYKRQNDNIHRKIRLRLNARIRACIIKQNCTLEYTGCSSEFLRKWMEFQFNDKLNWDN